MFEAASLFSGKGNGAWGVGTGKILYVDPVPRCLDVPGLSSNPVPERFELFGSGKAGYENIEPTTCDPQAKFERRAGSFLSNEIGSRSDLCGGVKIRGQG